MEKDKSYTADKLVKFAEAWQKEKKTRSIVILAVERDDADEADVFNLVEGNARDMFVKLAELINENPVIFKPAIQLAEVMEAKEKKKKGS